MSPVESRHTGDGELNLRLIGAGDVPHVIPTSACTVKTVLLGAGIEHGIEVMVPGGQISRIRGNADGPDQSLIVITCHELAQVIQLGAARRGEEDHPAVRVLVDEDVVEPPRVVRHPEPSHFSHLRNVGKPGHVEDDACDLRVGTAAPELRGLQVVVAVGDLEVLSVDGSPALVERRVLDSPLVDDLGVVGVREVDDVEAGFAKSRDIRVRPLRILFELDVAGGVLAAERNVRQNLDVGAALESQRPW